MRLSPSGAVPDQLQTAYDVACIVPSISRQPEKSSFASDQPARGCSGPSPSCPWHSLFQIQVQALPLAPCSPVLLDASSALRFLPLVSSSLTWVFKDQSLCPTGQNDTLAQTKCHMGPHLTGPFQQPCEGRYQQSRVLMERLVRSEAPAQRGAAARAVGRWGSLLYHCALPASSGCLALAPRAVGS